MKVQLAIISVIVITGVVLFMPNTSDLMPKIPDIFDSVKKDLKNVRQNSQNVIESKTSNSIDSINEQFNDLKETSSSLLSSENLPNSIMPTIFEETFFGKIKEDSFAPQQSVHRSGGGISKSSSLIPQVVTTQDTQTISFETLSLVTEKQSDGTAMLKYLDTSGKTISVTVTMRNEEKILFTGQFFSSSFEATVLDAADVPHFIDMVVEHEEFGTISASAFNPAGTTDTQINGVFTSD